MGSQAKAQMASRSAGIAGPQQACMPALLHMADSPILPPLQATPNAFGRPHECGLDVDGGVELEHNVAAVTGQAGTRELAGSGQLQQGMAGAGDAAAISLFPLIAPISNQGAPLPYPTYHG